MSCGQSWLESSWRVLNFQLGLFEHECVLHRGFTVICEAAKMRQMRGAAALSAISNLCHSQLSWGFYHHSVFSLVANLFPVPSGEQQGRQGTFSEIIVRLSFPQLPQVISIGKSQTWPCFCCSVLAALAAWLCREATRSLSPAAILVPNMLKLLLVTQLILSLIPDSLNTGAHSRWSTRHNPKVSAQEV